MATDHQAPFLGFQFPTTTPVPDEVFDVLMPQLSGAELKVLMYICRRTFGFKKESDSISLHQEEHHQGYRKVDETGLNEVNTYSLNMRETGRG
jgi:hypothetical protein